MSDVAPPQFRELRERPKRTDWDRARLGVVIPLCVVVAVAIVCIVVAALTSAQRANEVALDRETQLLVRGIAYRGEWAVRRLTSVALPNGYARGAPIESERQRIANNLKSLADHDFVLLADSADEFKYVAVHANDAQWTGAFFPELNPLLDYVRGRTSTLPSGVVRLTYTELADGPAQVSRANSFLQRFRGRLAIVSLVPLGAAAHDPLSIGGDIAAVVFAVMFVNQSVLADFADRLGLPNLHEVGDEAESGTHLFMLHDRSGGPVAQFAWTTNQPGAEIIQSVLPFIGIAFAAFALLAGLVLVYMRRTAAAIAAGEDRLRYLALHDPLCGLPNRIFFSERLESVIKEVRGGGAAAAVFYIDLDHFKDVNDTLGHPFGDEVIRAVTLRLSHMLRREDVVARLGGDEFAVVMPAPSDQAALQTAGDRMIAALCAPYSIDGHTVVIGSSIGIAVIDKRFEGDGTDVMRYADMALYRAKNEGRNRACIYDAVMDADLSQRKLIEQDLREAIENDKLDVAYQPIMNASGEKVVGVEALARWYHPVRGTIAPAEFIPIAEHSGLIIELGAHVLRKACLAGKDWSGIMVSVNVSPLQFRQIDFPTVVERILSETGFDPARLELELTESMLLGNVESAELAMQRLKALGVKLALDDFGTGYSSLLYLRRFPFDRLKIDRTFVMSIEKAPDAAAIVHAVVSLGRGLGMKVTAEGVETAEQHLFLRAAGVHCMQGFRFGRASPAAEITRRIANPGVYRTIESDAAAALAS